MPCGGIYPIPSKFVPPLSGPNEGGCLHCQGGGEMTHFCEEWDGFLHQGCIGVYLLTKEGQVITNHDHPVIMETYGTYWWGGADCPACGATLDSKGKGHADGSVCPSVTSAEEAKRNGIAVPIIPME